MTATKVKYSPRSTAAKTNMFKVCKGCRKDNDNGYQYCTPCNLAHRAARKTSRLIEAVSPPTREQLLASAEKFEIDWNLGK